MKDNQFHALQISPFHVERRPKVPTQKYPVVAGGGDPQNPPEHVGVWFALSPGDPVVLEPGANTWRADLGASLPVAGTGGVPELRCVAPKFEYQASRFKYETSLSEIPQP